MKPKRNICKYLLGNWFKKKLATLYHDTDFWREYYEIEKEEEIYFRNNFYKEAMKKINEG